MKDPRLRPPAFDPGLWPPGLPHWNPALGLQILASGFRPPASSFRNNNTIFSPTKCLVSVGVLGFWGRVLGTQRLFIRKFSIRRFSISKISSSILLFPPKFSFRLGFFGVKFWAQRKKEKKKREKKGKIGKKRKRQGKGRPPRPPASSLRPLHGNRPLPKSIAKLGLRRCSRAPGCRRESGSCSDHSTG